MKKTMICTGIFLLAMISLRAQVSGCTDVLANNYDPSATVNDGSCIYSPSGITTPVVTILDNEMKESSTVELFGNALWTLNDSGNDPVLYGFDSTSGAVLRTWTVRNDVNEDWEELALGNQYVYIGDFGNNNGDRTDLKILRLSLDSLDQTHDTSDAEFIYFSYPDQVDFSGTNSNHNFDCEAFIFWNDSLHLFSKNRGDGYTKHYVLPAIPGTYVAILRDSLNAGGLVTGADMSADSTLVLCGYTPPFYSPFLWVLWDYPAGHVFGGNKRMFSLGTVLNNGQQEGIVFTGVHSGFISSEKVGKLNLDARLYRFDLSPYFVNPLTILSNETKELVPVITESTLKFDLPCPLNAPARLELIDSSGRIVMERALKTCGETSLPLSRLETGLYTVSVKTASGYYFGKFFY